MKKYYINGKEVSKQEAEQVQARNRKLTSSGNLEDWLNVEFIVVVEL